MPFVDRNSRPEHSMKHGTLAVRPFRRMRHAALILCAVWAPVTAAQAQNCLTPRAGPFRVYDGMFYRGQPDLKPFGLRPLRIIDRGIWIDEATRAQGDPAKFRAAVGALPDDGAPIVLDLESISLEGAPGIANGLSEIGRITSGIRRYSAKRSIGLYGTFPRSEYWRAIDSKAHGGIASLRRDNDKIASIDRMVDAVYPSLYTFYDDRAGWVAQAKSLVCEARRLSKKPVYVFIWPEYHPSSVKKNQWLPRSYWELQLDTLREIADGVVIWGGFDMYANRSRQWDPNAAWWSATRQRMAQWKAAAR